jgi:uncharacterized protein
METIRSERFPQLFWGLVALALGLVLAGAIGAGAFKAARRAADQIEVTGSAKRQIRSDLAIWHGTVSAQAATLQDGFTGVTAHTQRLRQFLAQSGVADSLVTVDPVATGVVYGRDQNGNPNNEVVGYQLTQHVSVRSSDVNAVTALSQRAQTLIQQGVPLQSGSPEYLYTKLSEVRTQLLAEATEDAKTRAEAVARSAGAGIGAVRSARQGVFQITPRNSTEVSDYGINDTSSLEKDITAVVRVTFAVK